MKGALEKHITDVPLLMATASRDENMLQKL